MNLQVTTKTPLATSREQEAIVCCQQAWAREMDGDWAGAWSALSPFCSSLGTRPDVSGLSPATSAELLLRAGTVNGWLGSSKQLERSQEFAKDLISESRSLFEGLDLIEKAADASNGLAVCYWREGAYDEARATLRHALTQLSDENTEVRLRTLLNLAVVERSSLRWRDALQVNRAASQAFKECTNHSLLGKFHNEYATVLKNVGLAENREDYIDQALVEYAAASFHLEQVGNRRFQAVTENNQALVFSNLGRFSEAHEHLDRARSLCLSVQDRGGVAQVDESRARVFLAEGKTAEAERVVRGSVRTLMRGAERSLLAEALTTHGVALARLNRREEARTTFKRAVDIAERGGDPETAGIAALTMVEELESYLGIEARQSYIRAESLLKKSQDVGVQQRLGACARSLLEMESSVPPLFGSDNSTSELAQLLHLSAEDSQRKYSLEDRVLQYEGHIIKRALEASGGSVTKAARLLGITHQGLAFILNGRHKHLLAVRTPVKPRRRSIIRYPK